MTTARYDTADTARIAPEPAKDSTRSAFARDRARVLHCGALRRLAGKTQVLQAGQSDVPRTRLTHSLEVAQVARELGQALGCDPDVVDVAGLAHDLGHPPFGHNGEAELDRISAAAGGFEGNAQTFRILTRLEAKVIDDGTSRGLNLTRAALDATTKYPWPRVPDSPKFGHYPDDAAVFDWVRADAPAQRRCLEAQVMDWADDVAYSVHDIDDAVQLGMLDPAVLLDPDARAAVGARCREWYLPDADPAACEAALLRLMDLPFWVTEFDQGMAALARVKQMTSALIARFSSAAERATRREFGPEPLHRYDADLVVPADTRLEVAMMKALAATYVMVRPGSDELYAEQRRVLADVVAALMAGSGESIEPWLRPAWDAAGDDDGRLRVVLDQVASLTDLSVLRWHADLCGTS